MHACMSSPHYCPVSLPTTSPMTTRVIALVAVVTLFLLVVLHGGGGDN